MMAAYSALQASGGVCVLATVVGTRGSSYRSPGARMLILPDGSRIGAVSGGCLEGELCRRAHGFVYGVNVMGVTGERASVGHASAVLAKRLKAVTDKPVIMGFGVSTPAQAVAAAAEADGVVVASALMRLLLEGGGPAAVADAVAELRAALDRG